jgi:hypothetical protein
LQALRVSDGMKGGTPAILYDLCLVLDKLYSEPIDGLPEPGQDVTVCLVHDTVECVSSTCAQCLLHHGQGILPHAT